MQIFAKKYVPDVFRLSQTAAIIFASQPNAWKIRLGDVPSIDHKRPAYSERGMKRQQERKVPQIQISSAVVEWGDMLYCGPLDTAREVIHTSSKIGGGG